MVSLKNLNMNFHKSIYFKEKIFYHLSQTLKGLPSLESFSGNFIWCREIGDEGLRNLSFGLKEAMSLKEIHLNFKGCHKITNKGFEPFTESLKEIGSITKLHLEFSGTGAIIKTLCESLKGNSLMEDLRLEFQECPEIYDPTLKFMSETLKTLPALKGIDLDLQGTGLTDEAWENLKQGFEGLCGLRRMRINFAKCCDVGNNTLIGIGETLKLLPDLRDLNIDFYECKGDNGINDEGLYSLSEGLKSTLQIRDLKFVCRGCDKVTDQGLERLSRSLMGLENLENINLDLYGCKGFSDDAPKTIEKALKKLKFLKKVELRIKSFYIEVEQMQRDTILVKNKDTDKTSKGIF